MSECRDGMFLTTLCALITVLRILSRGVAEGKSMSLDVSQVRINPLECYDRTNSCEEQAEDGFCETNYHYMMDRCPWSCRFCRRAGGDTDNCMDISKHCSHWVSKKECTTHPDYMAQNCKKSCEMCGPESDYNLTDKETTCPLWAKAGWCRSNQDLLDKCPHSCQKYGVQGANSMDERYITVNFQNSSSVTSSKVVEIVAPPPPSAAIRSHSDLDTLPPDLKQVLAKEWWDSKLLKLTQKQNEYVTHPEPRPMTLPIPHESNHTLNATQSDKKERNKTESGPIQQQEMVTVPAPAPPPRAYDSLLPKLFLSGGPTWINGKGNETTHRNTNFNTQANQEIWKEEKEEDQDLSESGQQKGEVPFIRGKSDDRRLNADVSSSGSGWSILKEDINNSGEKEANHYDQGSQTTPIVRSSSGSGEESEVGEYELKTMTDKEVLHHNNLEQNSSMKYSSSATDDVSEDENIDGEMESKQEVDDGDGVEKNSTRSGRGEKDQTRKHVIVAHSPGSRLATESIKIILPENDFSGNGKNEDHENRDYDGVSLSGSGSYDTDDNYISASSGNFIH